MALSNEELADSLADAIAQFAVQTNPYTLSIGIDQAYNLADSLLPVIEAAR